MIEGIPDGWELVRIGTPKLGVDTFLADDGTIKLCNFNSARMNCAIIRKKPKQYRPFANAAEFAPHRDRWIYSAEQKSDNPEGAESPEDEYLRVLGYSDSGVTIDEYGFCFDTGLRYFVFADDGSPFGVEVQP